MSAEPKKVYNDFNRTIKDRSPFPRFVFSVLRAIDPYLQYLVLFGGYGQLVISKTGLTAIPAGPKGDALVAMAASCAIKQIINMIFISEEQLLTSAAITISIFNTVSNGLASFSALLYGPSTSLDTLQYVGIGLFGVGLLTEFVSEVQRKQFKDNPANKGKNYTGGLFSLARHINYGGYTIWRTGLALTSGNYWLAALAFTWHTWDFTTRAVPSLTLHCREKYGESWKKFEHDTQYILFPYIW